MFDSFVIVDWSAASQPKTGRDSIWICAVDRDGVERLVENPQTRHNAKNLLRELLSDAMARGERVLLGFDFPFGYPAGFAQRLGLHHAPPWRAVWDEIAARLKDAENNNNDRFTVAAEFNRRVSNRAFPFWGCPVRFTDDFLGPKHHNGHAADGLAEQRHVVETEEAWTLGVTRARQRAAPAPTPTLPRLRGRGASCVNRADETLPRKRGREDRRASGGPVGAEIASRVRKYTYLRDPEAIYRASFAAIRAEADLPRFPAVQRSLALRLAHAAGDVAILDDLVSSRGAVQAGRRALAAGASILVDAEMVAAGIIRDRLPAQNRIICTLREAEVAKLAAAQRTTRSAAAVELWRPHLQGAVVAIGNAPTALFRLLVLLAAGADRPALVLGFPVGFVGAAEAKEALTGFGGGLGYVALRGRRGGSALAAAAVNALAAGAR